MITWSDPKYINNKLFKTFILLFVFPNTTFFFLHWGCASQILPVATEILSLGQIKENTFYKFYGIMKLWNSTSTKFKGTGSRRCLDMDWRSETGWQGVAVVSTVTSQEQDSNVAAAFLCGVCLFGQLQNTSVLWLLSTIQKHYKVVKLNSNY